jgi:2-desacetyl-2-hydroxyethyl bacteriochlorophyllide A dehydrogenase
MISKQRRSLYFTAPRTVEVRSEAIPSPRPDEVLVQTIVSAISPGTEMLFYRDQIPAGMAADATIAALSGEVVYPFKYGYACIGEVTATGADVDPEWIGRRVFAFHPHESHFCTRPEALIAFPSPMKVDRAALLPNAETAINLIMDGAPLVGERIIVVGQGIVGLLVTKLLASFPLNTLYAIDPIEGRRRLAEDLGALKSFTPDEVASGKLAQILGASGADLIFELSGNPKALNGAIQHSNFGGRIVVGSWYGVKQAALDLGGRFHRNRTQIISSQVSTIAPHLQGRWNKERRLAVAWTFLTILPLDRLITHRFPIEKAADVYRLLDHRPQETLQVLFEY